MSATFVAAGVPAGAAVHTVPPILVELPDRSVMPLDQAPRVRSRLTMPISRWWSTTPDWMTRSLTMYGATVPFCPPSRVWVFDGGASNQEAARRECDRQMRARLVDYPQADRDRCACAAVLSGRPSERLRVLHPVFADHLLYVTATVVVTRAGGVERLRASVPATPANGTSTTPTGRGCAAVRRSRARWNASTPVSAAA